MSPDEDDVLQIVAAPGFGGNDHGLVAPLYYIVATHRGSYVLDIDPQEHRLMIHGMVDRPLIFTMDELKRLPFVTRAISWSAVEIVRNPRIKTCRISPR